MMMVQNTAATQFRRSRQTLIRDCPRCGYKNALSVIEKDGRQLYYCHAGCSPDSQGELLSAINGGVYNHEYVRPVTHKSTDTSLQKYILRLWQSSLPAGGTIIEHYLRARGITAEIPASLRFLPRHPHKSTETYWPVMLAVVTDIAGKVQALHRTYLSIDGKSKAPVKPAKMTLGVVGGHATHLSKAGKKLAIVEGLETGMSIMQATDIPTWAALSAGGMERLILPPLPLAQEVIIAADNDANGVGQRAAELASLRWLGEGRRVRIALPPKAGYDFNDIFMGGIA